MMKTDEIRRKLKNGCKELNRAIEDLNTTVIEYRFVENDERMFILRESDEDPELIAETVIVMVAKDMFRTYSVCLDESSNLRVPYEFIQDTMMNLLKYAQEYANTPFEEREGTPEKRWYLHIADNWDGYLNYNKNEDKYFTYMNDENKVDGNHVEFSRSEIAVYLKTNNEAFIDDFINRFGEEVKE